MQTRFHATGKVCGFSMTVHMHEEDVWIIPEEMIVERRDIDSIVEKRGENRIHFVLQQHQVAHHHIRTIRRFGQCNPAAETEGRGRGDALDRHLQVAAGDIDLENACFEVAFTVERFENLLIITRYVLRKNSYAG